MATKRKPLLDKHLKWPARESVAHGHKATKLIATTRPDAARKAPGHK